jgi:hypothetical protein
MNVLYLRSEPLDCVHASDELGMGQNTCSSLACTPYSSSLLRYSRMVEEDQERWGMEFSVRLIFCCDISATTGCHNSDIKALTVKVDCTSWKWGWNCSRRNCKKHFLFLVNALLAIVKLQCIRVTSFKT